MTAGDNLVGGSGTDTLNIAVTGAKIASTAVGTVTPALTGVEKVLVSNANLDTTNAGPSTGFSVDLSLADSSVNLVGTSASNTAGELVEFKNVGALANVQMAGTGDLKVGYTTATVAGSADAITLTAKM